MRDPVVAGQFYAGSANGLRSQVEECFTDAHGPGEIPGVSKGPRKLLGLVSPHAGYPYSGPVAAHGFSKLAEDGKPESVIIIGPNHTGAGPDISFDPSDGWRTPLGEVDIDKDLRDSILDKVEMAELDSYSHSREHSLEVQLPFLQYLFDDDFQIVPICMKGQNVKSSEALGNAIGESVSSDVLIIASTDLTHYESPDVAESRDRKVIEKIEGMDWKGVVELVTEKGYSVCGYGPVSSTLLATENLGAERTELFKYATSGDTAGPSREVVGYCSLGIFK
ncbi:hypothetical protein AKJ62_02910 [candidate division MSBL1 archaeon SCGC-AAA259D14]|uniref:MEMO1 family protein AKJ62_02910 n=1 Tax=candidate division MSBL1 archaeon SCGC-AAA259D14 TaxID=1698261 RepID=A0A133U5T3_9EURY|nr:hypothetical protein AKJ62_02910 [candidate division MSBL1 archaeon SCGC-AAA259D14]